MVQDAAWVNTRLIEHLFYFQISMSVLLMLIPVPLMLSVPTHLAASPVQVYFWVSAVIFYPPT